MSRYWMIRGKAIILAILFETQISKETIVSDLPVTLVRGLDELHREKELYGADQQTTEIERQSEGAQRQSDLVDDHELLWADKTIGRDC